MSIWEKYQARLRQQGQGRDDEERMREEARRKFEAENAAKRTREQTLREEIKRRAMEAFNRINASSQFNEIASHIPRAKVDLLEEGDSGYLTLRVSWERDKIVHYDRSSHFESKKAKKQIEKMRFGIDLHYRLNYPELPPNHQHEFLTIGSAWSGYKEDPSMVPSRDAYGYVYNYDQNSLEEALVKGLEHQQWLMDKPFFETTFPPPAKRYPYPHGPDIGIRP